MEGVLFEWIFKYKQLSYLKDFRKWTFLLFELFLKFEHLCHLNNLFKKYLNYFTKEIFMLYEQFSNKKNYIIWTKNTQISFMWTKKQKKEQKVKKVNKKKKKETEKKKKT